MKCPDIHRKVMVANPTAQEHGKFIYKKKCFAKNEWNLQICIQNSCLQTIPSLVRWRWGSIYNFFSSRNAMKCPYQHTKVMVANNPTHHGVERDGDN